MDLKLESVSSTKQVLLTLAIFVLGVTEVTTSVPYFQKYHLHLHHQTILIMISPAHIFAAWFHKCLFLFLSLIATAFLNALLMIAHHLRINQQLIEFVRLIAGEASLQESLEYLFVDKIIEVAKMEEGNDVHVTNYLG